MWKEREMKNWHKESRCPESGGEKEARKNENVMGGLREERSGKSGRRMENNSKRQKELENAVREKCGEERKDKRKTNLTPEDRDNKSRTIKCIDQSIFFHDYTRRMH